MTSFVLIKVSVAPAILIRRQARPSRSGSSVEVDSLACDLDLQAGEAIDAGSLEENPDR